VTVQEALTRSGKEIRARVEEHQRLLARLTEGGDARIEGHLLLDCPHRRRLRETLAETIGVLEETKKSFKSRKLEALRKKLTGVLAEDA